MKDRTVYLVLENGKVFSGHSFGASGETVGEIAVSTSMVGYLETLTDPSYFGQIVVQTFPSIGNYGVMASDLESDAAYLKAYIVVGGMPEVVKDYVENYCREHKHIQISVCIKFSCDISLFLFRYNCCIFCRCQKKHILF